MTDQNDSRAAVLGAQRDGALQPSLRPSRYNLLVGFDDDRGAVYNRRTGACIALDSGLHGVLAACLKHSVFTPRDLIGVDDALEVSSQLLAGGFVVESDCDELALLKRRYEETRKSAPYVVTVVPTFDCNFDCTYCVVGKKHGSMSRATEELLQARVERDLDTRRPPSMSIDWFGGEPLMAPRTVERVSLGLRGACASRGISYHAQLITNGSLVTPQIARRLSAWGIDRVQVTIDGLRDTHNSRRPWKGGGRSSFDDVMRALDMLVGTVVVRLRVNVDRNNIGEVDQLLPAFEMRGWLKPDSRFYPYPSVVAKYTDACRWSPDDDCGMDAYFDLRSRWMQELTRCGVPVLMQGLYGFPEPRPYCCGAVGASGFIVTPDGMIHRCGFDSDDDDRAVGRLGGSFSGGDRNDKYWQEYDPFVHTECLACEALPSCLAGCPRARRDGRAGLIAEACAYYRIFESKALAQHVRLSNANR